MIADAIPYLAGAAIGLPPGLYLARRRLRRTLPAIRAGTPFRRRGRPRDRVYLLRMGADGPIKIGTTTDPYRRLRSLQTGCPEPLHLLLLLEGGPALEASLHRRFRRLHVLGEWYEPGPELLTFVAHQLDTRVAS